MPPVIRSLVPRKGVFWIDLKTPSSVNLLHQRYFFKCFSILKSLFAFRRVKVKRSSRKKKWQILCEGCSCAIHPPCHSVYPSFLVGTQLARKWQRGWQPSSQRKMRYFTLESDNSMIFLPSEVHLALLIKLARSLRSVAKA